LTQPMNSPNFELILSALNEGSNGIILINSEYRIVFWNRWMDKKTGFAAKAVMDQPLGVVFPELTGSRVVQALRQTIEDGLPAIISHKLNPTPFPLASETQDKAGGKRMSQMVRIVALNQPDKQRYALIQIDDITQTVLREETLRRQTRELELREKELLKSRETALHASSTKGEFLANMSHEIRTPLNAIIGLTNLAIESQSSEQQVDFLGKIESAGSTLLGLVNDILDFSKIEAGKLEVQSHPFELQDIVNHITDFFTGPTREKNISLEIHIEPNTPNFLIGDGLRLRQILVNLVNNALKFTSAGQIVVRVGSFNQETAVLESGEIATLHFQVLDSGIGLEKEQIPQLFQSFTQADGSTSRKFGGTGLGLAICKRLVELMDGAIWVESKKDKGSNFQFSLPLIIADAQNSRSNHQIVLNEKQNLSRINEELNGLQALIVEDNEINQEVAAELLRRSGMQVTIANHGQEALDLLAITPVDIILMDIQMPVMDGLEATQAIRKKPRFKDVPIIAITANAILGDRERCLQSGMTDYITKPIRKMTLLSCMAKWTSRKKARSTESCPPIAEESSINLDSAVRSTQLTQPIDSPGKTGEDLITNKVTATSPASPDKSIDYAMHALPTAESRIKVLEGYIQPSPDSGLDYVLGLEIVDGNLDLYLSLLTLFSKKNLQTIEEIIAKIAGGNIQSAVLLTHSLKGSAANIGATNLHKAAANLEEELLN
jgi:two-component system, sensor histidine kinase and response regulator